MNHHSNESDSSCPSSIDIVEIVHAKAHELVKLTRDVFISPYDLVLLDRTYKIFGGYWGDSHEGIAVQDILGELFGVFPMGWTEHGSYYFLPGLGMDPDLRAILSSLPDAGQFEFFVRAKRALVDSEPCQATALNRDFWLRMLGNPTSVNSRSNEGDVNERLCELFLYERYLGRFGGDPRALDQFVGPEFKLEDAIAAVKVLVSRLPLDAVKRHRDACGAHRSIAA